MGKDRASFLDYAYATMLSGLIVYFGEQALTRSNYIPKTEQVQQGFVIPNKLEIKLQDLDNNGEDEVLIRYDGKEYLLRLDDKGRPQVQAYEIQPAKIVPGLD